MHRSNNMRKKIILTCGGILIIAISVLILVLLLGRTKYTIKVSLVDSKSPDRMLTVYEGDKKIEVKRIEYLDGTLLCNGYNTAVYFGDINKVKELKIILKDNKEVIAKVVEEEVKR